MKTKKHIQTLKLCTAALMLAAGILLPQVFHMFGGQAMGGMLLPMHIPVLTAGLLLGPFYGGAIGLITPVASFLIMSMPPAAKLPFMIAELVSYGLVSGLLRSKNINIYVSLIGAQIIGRIVYALALVGGTYIFAMNIPPLLTFSTTFVTGIPGVIAQIIFVPAVVILVERVIRFDRNAEGM